MNARARTARIGLMTAVLLVATLFRLAALLDAPPGWRDDDLLDLAMDRRIVDGWRPLYITDAEGHEPLHHYLHAIAIEVFGDRFGYRWLSMAAGVLGVALTYALARRLFGAGVGLVAAALMAVSFWPVMYARFGLRQIGLLPWMLGAYYAATAGIKARLPPQPSGAGSAGLKPRNWPTRQVGLGVAGGVCLAAALMTYFAGRVLPVVILAFGAYWLLVKRQSFRRNGWRIATVLLAGVGLAAPMFVVIERVAPGGEQRLEIVGPQLAELRRGNLQPAIQTTLDTLGMFTFKGDTEALYNVEGRPVFDWLSGAFFYAGLALAIWRWQRAEYGFTLIALLLGIAPAFVSNPPGSFSHTIAAMPIVYVLAGLGLVVLVEAFAHWLSRWLTLNDKRTAVVVRLSSFALIVALNAGLTVRDYFGVWAHDDYVQFLYHAPTRQIAQWLNRTPDVVDVAIATHLNYLSLDPNALRLDLTRDDVRARWFDPASALVYPAPAGLIVGTTLSAFGEDVPGWHTCCGDYRLRHDGDGFAAWDVGNAAYWDQCAEPLPQSTFDNRLSLLCAVMRPDSHGDEQLPAEDELWLDLIWRSEQPDLPATLRVFVHLVDTDGNILGQYDGMGVFLPSLQVGDRFVEFARLRRPADVSGPLLFRIGLYDAAANVRWLLPDGREFVTIEMP